MAESKKGTRRQQRPLPASISPRIPRPISLLSSAPYRLYMNAATKMHFTLEKRLILATAISFLIILIMCPKDTEARPDGPWLEYRDHLQQMGTLDDTSRHSNKCKTSEDTETLCQHCAKQTKSTLAYPMCCEDREGATDWCYRYVNYGRFPKK